MALPVEINPLQLQTSGAYSIAKSLRFRSSASAYLNRTLSVAGNRQKFTISTWIKRGTNPSTGQILMAAGTGTVNQDCYLCFGGPNTTGGTADTLCFYSPVAGNNISLLSTALYRDFSAWYHVVVAVDTTQATASNRVLMYVNGSQITAFTTATYPTLNQNLNFNNTTAQQFAAATVTPANFFDGYLAEINFIDGQALTPSSFGAYDTNGVWQPKKYTGTYGTNGFYLPFSLNSTSTYAGSFNGTSQSLATTSGITNQFTPTSGFTFEIWAYQNNSGSNQGFYVGGGANSWSTSNGYLFGLLFGSSTQWQWNNAGATFALGFSIPSNQWSHIAIGYNGTTTRVWVNGISVGTSTSPYTIPSTVNQYVVGSNFGATSNFYTGNLSNLRFVKGTDVYGVGNATISVPTGPLTAITNTQLLTLQNATVIDNSTNAFTIINTGSVATATATPFVESVFSDASGNNNTWAGNNINYSTTGSTYDSMTDSPTVTSASVANYAVFNPLWQSRTNSPTNGNLDYAASSVGIGTIGMSSGSYYWEITSTGGTTTAALYSTTASSSIGVTTGLTYGFRFNATTGAFDYTTNGSSFTSIATGLTTGPYFPYVSTAASTTASFNAGQRPFSYTPPTGFNALNTYNLAAPTIANGAKYMAATTYTGNGSTLTINNGTNTTIGTTFQPDFAWLKSRSAATSNSLSDVLRGIGVNSSYPRLISDSTAAESTNGGITSFASTGLSLNADAAITNTNAATYVAWQWKANGAGVSNTNGSITSTVSANTTAGFSVVTYTGTGASNPTIGHGLGVTPNMIILKDRNTNTNNNNWQVYHSSLTSGYFLVLNATDAQAAISGTSYGSVGQPTSTTFKGVAGSVDSTTTNQNTQLYVAYCWSAVAGYSAFGSYTGNASTDGTFVYTGFRPRWIILKDVPDATAWFMFDSSRDTYNVVGQYIQAQSSSTEATQASVDFLSNGFKLRVASDPNRAVQYIYAAFAENPFNSSRAR